jgi:hypothetical protein
MSSQTMSRGLVPHEDEYSEGFVAKAIEEQTAKLPSDVFLWAACRSMVGSLLFQLMGEDKKPRLSVNGHRRC